MAMTNLHNIVAEMIRHGRPATTPVAVIRDGTTPRQVTVVGTLATIVNEVERAGVGAPAIVAVGEGVGLRNEIRWFDAHGLFGKRVLITRPQAERDDLIRRLWECGAEPVVVPSIAYAPAPDMSVLTTTIAKLQSSRYAWLIFTSRHGVDTFFLTLAASGLDARALAPVKIAVVGEKTAAALQRHGLRADLMPATFTAAAVAEALCGELKAHLNAHVLAWVAEGASDTLSIELCGAGHTVDVVAAYTTRQTLSPELEQAAAETDIWTFASTSALDGFLAAVPQAVAIRGERIVACLGPVTAKAARERGLAPDIVAAQATSEALLDALKTLPAVDAAAV